jgi:dCTP deaminase
MIASAQTIRKRQPISPLMERTVANGMTFGLGPAGYDIRAAEDVNIPPGGFVLGSSLEHFNMPNDMLGVVHDKSSWARKGLCVQNTVIEPGWRGFLTLEYTNHLQVIRNFDNSPRGFPDAYIMIKRGDPIAQIIFHMLDESTEFPYEGKYQDQEAGPQPAREQKDADKTT